MNLNDVFNEMDIYTKEKFDVFSLKNSYYYLNEEELRRFNDYIGINQNKLITYCHKCKKEFSFDIMKKYIGFDFIRINNIKLTSDFSGFIGGMIDIQKGVIIGAQGPYPMDSMLNSIGYIEFQFKCNNNSNHKYLMILSIEINDGCFIVRKVGQNPSMLTIKGFDFDKYKNQLERINAYQDYKKADLSNTEQFHVGAYAYLRRIFEKMINSYLDKKNIKKHMDEKIEIVKEHFDPRVRNMLNNLYGILSISIHELDEDKSKEYYEYLKAIIEIQLEFEFTEEEKKKQTDKLQKILNKIENEIKDIDN